MKLRRLLYAAIMAAAICIFAPWSIPVGAVPITLCTFAIYVVSSMKSWKHGLVATVIYVALGTVGIPVFSGFAAGFEVIAGPTGGFILGYIPCSLIIGLITDKLSEKAWAYPLSMLLGTIVCYAVGTAWFMWQANASIAAAIAACILPFIVIDIVKIFVAGAIAPKIRRRLKKLAEKHP